MMQKMEMQNPIFVVLLFHKISSQHILNLWCVLQNLGNDKDISALQSLYHEDNLNYNHIVRLCNLWSNRQVDLIRIHIK